MKVIFTLAVLVPVFSIAQLAKPSTSTFEEKKIQHHVETLASDSFQGRKPFTVGETKTIDYLTTQLKSIGLEPGNRNSYIQEVTTVRSTYASSDITVQSARGDFKLLRIKDYAIKADGEDTLISLQKIPVVFVGYGIVAPEYNRNDYAGIDVKGKVVLVLADDVEQEQSFLDKGKASTKYETIKYKHEEAVRQGALSCFLILPPIESHIFETIQPSMSREILINSPPDNLTCSVRGVISREALIKLFDASGLDSSMLIQAGTGSFKPLAMNLSFSTTIDIKSVYRKSANVIGKINGSDHADETIIYCAHWDHLGIGIPDAEGDSIYNGANDNALGVSVVLELARGFIALKPLPSRSIVFIFFTLEETGMLGSTWYTRNPIYPLQKTVAAINVDGFNRYGRSKNIELNGPGNSTLEDDLEKKVKGLGRYITPGDPDERLYYRSDQISFARAGIPALFISRGIDYLEGGTDYEKIVREKYYAYHTPNDEFNEGWRFDGTIEDMEILFNLGKDLANNRVWPQWKSGSEFKSNR